MSSMDGNRITWEDVERHLAERAAARPKVDKVRCFGCGVMFEPWTNEFHCSDECFEKHRAQGSDIRR